MPRNATEVGARRHYKVPGATGPIPSVTTILKFYPKEWLAPYAAKSVAGRAVGQFPELVRRMWDDGHDDATKWLKAAPWEKRDTSADQGRAGHAYLEGRMRGWDMVPAMDRDLPMRVEEKIDLWIATYRPRPIEIEFQVASTHVGYAGSGDLIAEVYGRTYLIDLKTSGTLGHEPRLQLAAYRYADFLFEDNETRPLPPIDACAVLHIPQDNPDHWSFLEVEAGLPEFNVFLNVLSIYRFHEAAKDAGIGEVILPQAAA